MNVPNSIIKIFWITLIWILLSVISFLMAYSALLDYPDGLKEDQSPLMPFVGSIITGTLAGLLGGSIMVLVWEKWLRSLSYGKALIYILTSFTVIFFLVAIPGSLFHEIHTLNLSITDSLVWSNAIRSLKEPTLIAPYLFWLLIVLITLIFLQVNDKFGPGIFKEFLLGRYFQPKREERIFMFLDLRSSTTIAENIGEEKYFNFLKEVFSALTPAILKHEGEIYQYVGDEIVISWKPKSGLLNANCIECFFDIQKELKLQSPYFEQKYGESPEFKAGLHSGHVMAGEIGVIKKDIAFSGDVLNTTSRIQEQCNSLGVDLLLSDALVEKLKPDNPGYQFREIGNVSLKGKAEEMTLCTV